MQNPSHSTAETPKPRFLRSSAVSLAFGAASCLLTVLILILYLGVGMSKRLSDENWLLFLGWLLRIGSTLMICFGITAIVLGIRARFLVKKHPDRYRMPHAFGKGVLMGCIGMALGAAILSIVLFATNL